MFKVEVENILKEYVNFYDEFEPNEIVRFDVWFGRVISKEENGKYKVILSTPDGLKKKILSGEQLKHSYPIEFASEWNGCGGNATDILVDEEWNEIKENHPIVYENCLMKVASNTSYGAMLKDWVFEFLMSEKNPKQGKPGTVIDAVKNADFGPIMKYVELGEQLHDAIIRLWKEALYVTEDKMNVFMSY